VIIPLSIGLEIGRVRKSTNPKLQIGESDLAAQARIAAAQVARGAQTGAKNAADGFNRFVEGNGGSTSSGGAYRSMPLDESKKDFWDSFAEAGNHNSRPSAMGTSSIKKGNGANNAGGSSGAKGKMDGDDWDKW
jgi:ADP-ribosylation factor GTPase-activating protein 1